MAGHRVRAYGEHRDVGRGGVHLGREGDDKHRHQPDHGTAARPLFIHAHDLRLSGKAAPRQARQRRPAVAGRSFQPLQKGLLDINDDIG
ncbi:DNA-binding response regulator [Bifidobacterium adolescentis ATCC 15703]|uniref:DNA-binding response regulator n=1 Tax=Bifidobacterium adolescentis (strain ATCC 15703 / DSM 20083 / NCTC 11814 / E194a) TaxID=367928 RepID=A1A2W5_BIFAA|nr:DNA-binding response regulator [Bifidobacterium adolescentis ATCC 15703]